MMAQLTPAQRRVARRRFIFSAAGLYIAPLLGCALPGGGKAPRRIRLSAAESFAPNLPAVGWTLQVKEPSATLSLNTAKIAIGTRDSVGYLANGEWASRAPEMVMELLVDSFKNSNKILTVGDRRARIRPHFELELRLTEFHVEKTAAESGTVRVGLDAMLLRRPQRNVVSAFSFESSSEARPLSLDNIVSAFDESLRDVMGQLVAWTLHAGASP